jgi:biopolymer transport protein ExbD
MITRPLNLGSRLRPEPRNFDWLFVANAGLLVLFFSLFGSRFVLAPGLGLDFRLPRIAGANVNARPPTHTISVIDSGLIFTSDGARKLEELGGWLLREKKAVRNPLLLVRGGVGVPVSVMAEIANAAYRAGYEVLLAAEEAPPQPGALPAGR